MACLLLSFYGISFVYRGKECDSAGNEDVLFKVVHLFFFFLNQCICRLTLAF